MEVTPETQKADFLIGGGEMGERVRNFDWSNTPLGPPSQWPQSLRTSVSICLNSRFPMVLWWGLELILIYNDAWRPILGASKHPAALGSPGRGVFPEVWHIIGEQLSGVMRTGVATWSDDLLLVLERNYYREETYLTYSYSPILIEDGSTGGVFTAVTETTDRVLSQRRLQTLRVVGTRALGAETVAAAWGRCAQALRENDSDIPFALFYEVNEDGKAARLVETVRLQAGGIAAPESISLVTEGGSSWPVSRVAQTSRVEVVDRIRERFGDLPGGRWPASPTQAKVIPLVGPGQNRVVGVAVMGVSPYRELDNEYRSFLNRAVGHVATAVANASAYEAERRRAEALAEIDRAKTAFFSNVSHEFRTPLTLMLGPLESLLSHAERLGQSEREQVDVAYRNSLRLLKLVNSLLDFSRIEAGRLKASYAPVDLASLTVRLAANFRSVMEAGGLQLIVHCPTLPEPVYVDQEMWEKIVLNLLSNAFKFTLQGRVEVRLESREGRAVLTVTDTGTGIPESELPHIFERFHRVAEACGRNYEGTGIGLALVQELARLHGGAVTVESHLGVGSMFEVSIPLGSMHLPADRIGAPPATFDADVVRAEAFTSEGLAWLAGAPTGFGSSTPPAAGGERGRVLIVDDNADMREHLRRLLEPGHEVITAADGEAALMALRKGPLPDLVLSDIMMPRLDGFGLSAALRKDPATNTLPLIFISARAGEEARAEGMNAGADDYLVKPFSAREVVSRVEAHLRLRRLRQTAAAESSSARNRLSAALEAARMAAWEWDLTTRSFTWSENSEEIFGQLPAHGEEFGWKALHSDDLGKVRACVQEAVSRRSRFVSECRFSRPDTNETRWVEIRGNTGGDESGPPLKVFGVLLDITERKRTETALRETETKFRDMADSAPVLIWQTDKDGVVFVNRHYLDFFGVPFEGVRAMNWANFLHPDDATAYRSAYSAAFVRQESYEFRCRFRRYDGEYRWLQNSAAPNLGTDGVFLGFFGCSVDVSDILRTEKSLRESEERLAVELAASERLQGVSTELIADQPLEKLQEHLLDAAVAIMRSDFGSIQILDPDRAEQDKLLMLGSRGFSPQTAGHWDRVRLASESSAAAALRNRTRVVVEDLTLCGWMEGTEDLNTLLDSGVRAAQFTPLLSRDGSRPLGLISTYWRHPHKPSMHDLRLLDVLARQAADLLERSQAEEKLREQQRFAESIIEAAPALTYILDIPKQRAFLSKQSNPILGYAPEEMLAMDPGELIELLHPEDRSKASQHFERMIASCEDQILDIECRVRRKDGSWCWLFGRSRAFRRDPSGHTAQVLGVAADITALKRAESVVRKAEAELRLVSDAAPIYLAHCDRDGRYLFVNRAYAARLGLTTEEVIGKRMPEVLGEPSYEKIRDYVETVLRGEAVEFEVEVPFDRIGSRFMQASYVPDIDENGDVRGLVAAITDMTARRRMEEDLRRANADLEQFAYSASHDLQEPLRNVSIYSELLTKRYRDRLDEQGREFLDYVRKGSRRMEALIRDLLAYTQAGSLEAIATECNTSEVLDSVLAGLSNTIAESGARIVAREVQPVKMHAMHLQQLLQNLVGNAIKYRSPDRVPIVEIQARKEDGWWRLVISDNGIGIEEEYKERVFGLFKRLHTSDEYSGTGIGLAICQRIVERYGGRIWVESEVGKGSSFFCDVAG